MANLSGVRKRYARKLRRKAGLRSKGLVRAFSEVPRENFLGPGPWQLLIPGARKIGYVRTPDAHPRHLYDDVLVGILPQRYLNNGHPSSLASWLDWLSPKPGQHAVHVGCGTGYYTAIIAHAVSPRGRVTAIEIDDELAPRASANLSHLKHVNVVHGDGFAAELDPADLIFVNAGATRPSGKWLDALAIEARLLFPLITTHLVQLKSGFFRNRGGQPSRRPGNYRGRMVGMMIGVRKLATGYAAAGVSSVGIFPCITAIDREEDGAVAQALATRTFDEIRSLRRDPHQADSSCRVHGREVCVSTSAPR